MDMVAASLVRHEKEQLLKERNQESGVIEEQIQPQAGDSEKQHKPQHFLNKRIALHRALLSGRGALIQTVSAPSLLLY